jgi:hypothetical protein
MWSKDYLPGGYILSLSDRAHHNQRGWQLILFQMSNDALNRAFNFAV